tara:strand:- start:355 stop:543 length:189 start_codon:yes stop_codon:yes gene_type:complete
MSDDTEDVDLAFFHFALCELFNKHFRNGQDDDVENFIDFVKKSALSVSVEIEETIPLKRTIH